MCHIKKTKDQRNRAIEDTDIHAHTRKRVICLFLYIAQKPIVTINLFLICFKVKKEEEEERKKKIHMHT